MKQSLYWQLRFEKTQLRIGFVAFSATHMLVYVDCRAASVRCLLRSQQQWNKEHSLQFLRARHSPMLCFDVRAGAMENNLNFRTPKTKEINWKMLPLQHFRLVRQRKSISMTTFLRAQVWTRFKHSGQLPATRGYFSSAVLSISIKARNLPISTGKSLRRQLIKMCV